MYCSAACPAGQYRSESDTTCQQCPGDTVMDQEAAVQCECLDGYFRNDENNEPYAQVLRSAIPSNEIEHLLAANEQPSADCTRELCTSQQ